MNTESHVEMQRLKLYVLVRDQKKMERVQMSQLPVVPHKEEGRMKTRKNKTRDEDMEWHKVNPEEHYLSAETMAKMTEEEKEKLRAVLNK